jgi:ADP-ribosylglycohydrolase
VLIAVVNRGGDADTTGAVAGGLLGARDGLSAIPSRWLGALTTRARLGQLAKALAGLRGDDASHASLQDSQSQNY